MTRIKIDYRKGAIDANRFKGLFPRPPKPPECTCLSYPGDNKNCPIHGEEACYQELKDQRLEAETK